MSDKRKFLIVAVTLSFLALAALSTGIRVLQPFLIDIQQACQEQFTANEGESSSLCENGPTIMISLIQTLTVFIGGYLLLVRAMKHLNVIQISVISILFFIGTLVSEFGLPAPNTYITLPAEGFSDWLYYYLFVSKEVIFMTLLAFILVQPPIVRGTSSDAPASTATRSATEMPAKSSARSVKKPASKKSAKSTVKKSTKSTVRAPAKKK